jgi:hypothetical protein
MYTKESQLVTVLNAYIDFSKATHFDMFTASLYDFSFVKFPHKLMTVYYWTQTIVIFLNVRFSGYISSVTALKLNNKSVNEICRL